MATVVADASVVIGFLDPDDPHHRDARSALEQTTASHELVVPVVAYAEVMVGVARQPPAARKVVEGFFGEVVARVEPLTREQGRAGASLRAEHPGLGLPDALVIATGEALDAESILTADARWKGVSGRVVVISA